MHAAPVDPRVDGLLGLYRTHFTTLVRLAVLLVADHEVAVEIVDDVFVDQARVRGAAAGELPAVGSLRNAVVAAARERPPISAADAGSADELLGAIYALPHVQRESLVLQHYGALGDDDVVAAAGAPLDVVAARASEGLRAVASMLAVRDQQ